VDGSDVSPRLLAVAPVALEKSQLPSEIKSPTVIWATLAIDEKGQLQKFEFDDLAYEKVRPQVEGALHFWRFAPARRTGEPVAAALRVPLILDQPFRLITPDIPPKVIHREHPDYPLAMGESGLRGEVLMEFIVDKDGSVKNPIVKQTNNPGFNEAAIEALMKWRFEPGFKRGKAVCARMQQLFMFDLNGSGGRDFVTVTAPSKKKQQQLPPEFQYDVAPKPSGVLEPVYPYALLRDRIKGSATVAFLVNSKGEVGQLVVTAASKPEFGLAVAAAIEAFQFTPGLKAGQPTNAGLKIEQEFDYSGFGNVDAGRGAALLSIEKKHPEKILSAKKLDKPLQPLSRRPPVFPISLLGRLDRGSATAEVLIDEEGKVCLPRIVKATDPAFGYAAVQAVIDWRFEPPTVGGKPVVVRVQVPFEFTLPRQGDDAAKRADKAEGRQQ
jgi:TonB family protein